MHSLIASYTKFNFFTLFCRDETTHKTHRDYFLYFCKLWQLSEIIRNDNTCHVAVQNIIEWITCLFSGSSILNGEYPTSNYRENPYSLAYGNEFSDYWIFQDTCRIELHLLTNYAIDRPWNQSKWKTCLYDIMNVECVLSLVKRSEAIDSDDCFSSTWLALHRKIHRLATSRTVPPGIGLAQR